MPLCRLPTRRQVVDKINAKVAAGEVCPRRRLSAAPPPRRRARTCGVLTRPLCQTFFSFEFFPPKSDEGLENLWERMDTMVALQARRQSPPGGAWTRSPPSSNAHPAPPCRHTHARQSAQLVAGLALNNMRTTSTRR